MIESTAHAEIQQCMQSFSGACRALAVQAELQQCMQSISSARRTLAVHAEIQRCMQSIRNYKWPIRQKLQVQLVESRTLWGEPEWDSCSQCKYATLHRNWVDRLKQTHTSPLTHTHWSSTPCAQQERWLCTRTAEALSYVMQKHKLCHEFKMHIVHVWTVVHWLCIATFWQWDIFCMQ